MRQLADFASWLGLILIVVGVVYYTPKLVDYVTDDTPLPPAATTTAAGDSSARRHIVMNHPPGLLLPAPGRPSESMAR